MAAGGGLPTTLKAIQPYLKVAKEYEKRDPIVAYYCRLHGVQKGIKIDSKSPEGKGYLLQLMDQLEKTKKDLSHEDAIASDVVGQAHMDEQARQLFLWADTEDRAGRFNKNVVKSFYTASLIYDTLIQFGELSDEASQRQKYSKWKATYINKCLKEGVTPTRGPPGGDEDEFGGEFDTSGSADFSQPPYSPSGGGASPYPPSGGGGAPPYPPSGGAPPYLPGGGAPPYPPSGGGIGGYPPGPSVTGLPSSYTQPPAQPPSYQQPTVPQPDTSASSSGGGGPASKFTAQDFDKAQKYCRFASSALQYEDVATAIDNLQQALSLLQSKQ